MDLDRLERMLNVSRHMAETRTLPSLLDYVLDEAIRAVGAECGYVVLIRDDASPDYQVRRGQNGYNSENTDDQVSNSILNQVIATGQPLVLRDALSDPGFRATTSVALLEVRSIMCVPLVSRGDIIGAIYVENRSIDGRFDREALSPLTLLANQAAIAIENAALREELESRVAARTEELEQALRQVEQSWTEAVEANRLRMVWLNKIVHDLRAPLVIASGSLSMLQDGCFGTLEPNQSDWIGKSLEAVLHVKDLTNDLFDLARLEEGTLSLHPETTDLQTFLQNIYEIGTGLPWPKTVDFVTNISPSLPKISFDPLRVRQVLLNLLSNAQKFTTSGCVTLHARSLVQQQAVLLGVADTGEGIPTGKLRLLFERFQQIDHNPDRRRQGAGLGLAICRELVEMHGGRIWVESTPGVGSDFMFTLPLDPYR